jgi:arylsulfatase A-like enzyme
MATTQRPNILVIWGDDIGISNLSCYSHGLMGYQTPNIDRLAKEGMMFTDAYGANNRAPRAVPPSLLGRASIEPACPRSASLQRRSECQTTS